MSFVYLFLYFSLLVAKIRVRIGEWDFSSSSEPHSNIERKISKKIVHPKYNFFTYENDLALLKMDKRIDFQDNIIPICLPANDDLLIGKNTITACDKQNYKSYELKWSQLFLTYKLLHKHCHF